MDVADGTRMFDDPVAPREMIAGVGDDCCCALAAAMAVATVRGGVPTASTTRLWDRPLSKTIRPGVPTPSTIQLAKTFIQEKLIMYAKKLRVCSENKANMLCQERIKLYASREAADILIFLPGFHW